MVRLVLHVEAHVSGFSAVGDLIVLLDSFSLCGHSGALRSSLTIHIVQPSVIAYFL